METTCSFRLWDQHKKLLEEEPWDTAGPPPHIGPLENVRHWSWENAKDGKRPESLDT